MIASAQVSVYPLRQERLEPAVASVVDTLKQHGLNPLIGTMSTVVTGEAETVFAALSAAFDRAADTGAVVMTITVSNTCPIPEPASPE